MFKNLFAHSIIAALTALSSVPAQAGVDQCTANCDYIYDRCFSSCTETKSRPLRLCHKGCESKLVRCYINCNKSSSVSNEATEQGLNSRASTLAIGVTSSDFESKLATLSR